MVDQWSQPAAVMTPWTRLLIRLWPQKLHTLWTRPHISSNYSGSNNSCRKSLRTCLPKVANKATSHQFLSKPMQLAANPDNRDQRNTTHRMAQKNHQAYRKNDTSQWNCSSQRSSHKCSWCRALNDTTSICPIYSPGGGPPPPWQDQTLIPNRDAWHQVKRQKSFDIPQWIDTYTTLSIWPARRGSMRRNWDQKHWQYRLWWQRWTAYNCIGSLWS